MDILVLARLVSWARTERWVELLLRHCYLGVISHKIDCGLAFVRVAGVVDETWSAADLVICCVCSLSLRYNQR